MASSSDHRSSSLDSRHKGLDPQNRPTASSGKVAASTARGRVSGDAAQNRATLSRPKRSLLGGSDPRKARYRSKVRLLVLAVVALVIGVAIYLVMAYSGIFAIRRISVNPTEHISQDTVATLAAVPEGSTLFSINEAQIAQRIESNPWVQRADVSRVLPDELSIAVTERSQAAIVMLSNGSEAWRLSEDSYWIEAIAMQQDSSSAPLEQARAQAVSLGLVLVTDVPATVSPHAGMACSDESVVAVLAYLRELPERLVAKISYFKASSLQALSCVLDSGVEVALGSPSDIAWKGEVALSVLEANAGLVGYINVRTPDTPSWRGLDSNAASAIDTRAGDVADDLGLGLVDMTAVDDQGQQAQEQQDTGVLVIDEGTVSQTGGDTGQQQQAIVSQGVPIVGTPTF